ncbi:hypothetical protein CHS0354_023944 [Potamilus streckersoni]|uniref:Arginine biosynthesis bifunctional protein ArgJ, mitochondrial n=1 Tax=Potamilus streckersoni TaxID=2493646 RepID=A0AAE0RZD9_9BIVA|nr:hypothetical protein CHS0354_023944 [Potamilus streckersoni]
MDFVFIALPSGHGFDVIRELVHANKRIIDIGSDFRFLVKERQKYFEYEHTAKDLINKFVYGLTELNREKIKNANWVANPGCYPTSVILPLVPFLKSDVINVETPFFVSSVSGISGAGKQEKLAYSFVELNENVRSYKVGYHQHTPEIESALKLFTNKECRVNFVPHLIPVTRGIHSTIQVALKTKLTLSNALGVIGKRLPIENILHHIPELVLSISPNKINAVADAIMTTDLVAKQSHSVVHFTDGTKAKIYAIAKGSGMIAPNMATMLAFVMTDASISKSMLQKAISKATKNSFNRISVDGDESTNDMVLALANGMSENKIIMEHTKEFELFYNEIEKVLVALAKMIVKDGEGATKLLEIRIKGTKSVKDADTIAKSIAKSPLVKTAFYGADANWGRILCAMGYSGVSFNPEKVSIHFNDAPVLLPNYTLALNEEFVKKVLLLDEITVTVNLNLGSKESVFWTCDFSEKYVAINSNYRS